MSDAGLHAIGKFLFASRFRTSDDAYAVRDKNGHILCLSVWYAPWKCYVARSWDFKADMSSECLRDLANYLERRAHKRREER